MVNGETTTTELASILGDMTLALQDLHVNFVAGNNGYQFDNRDQFASNAPVNAVRYLSTISINTNTVRYGLIEELNVAYLHIKTLNGSSNFSPLEDVFADLPERDGVILDLRDNGGGSNGVARAFVNKLTTEERVYELVRFRNGPGRDDFGDWIEGTIAPDDPIDFDAPIVVLTNRGTVSSAESFVLMMSSLPNVTIVGDTTRGSTGNPKVFTLSNSWTYKISSWQAATIDFELIEDRGVAPDIAIANTESSVDAGLDLILERAFEEFE